ncbi:MAG: tRNA pseudouridine(55) synthase TruB [Geobacter sp.]|nr:tRNA pseudouridine(55) synthase TruB [Geobacter sp.]
MPDGFIVVDKPDGMTSHDVVARVRRCFGIKRVGHTGTLDPFATGVLPVAIGGGTKAIQFLDESVKEYRAVMRLGSATDTQDCTGTVLFEGDCSAVTPELLQNVITRFLGSISQTPPMYSAVKQGGVPLYKLARKGETVERAARNIFIESITVDSFQLPDVALTVRCSKGTYVRTLADDIGKELGCGAHLVQLRRTASGPFDLSGSVTMAELTADGAGAALQSRITAIAAALKHLRTVRLDAAACHKVRHGIALQREDVAADAGLILAGETVQLLCGDAPAAVAESEPSWGEPGARLRLLRVFDQDCPLHSAR